MKKVFIRFDSFLVDKNEIVCAEINSENHVVLTIRDKDQLVKKYTMIYSTRAQAKECLDKLSTKLDVHFCGGIWSNPLFTRMRNIECSIESLEEQIRKVLNELRKAKKKSLCK